MNAVMSDSRPALILLNVATAHGPFGGHVADSLQQVSCLANAAYDEENLKDPRTWMSFVLMDFMTIVKSPKVT